jgi:hypothetical protein
LEIVVLLFGHLYWSEDEPGGVLRMTRGGTTLSKKSLERGKERINKARHIMDGY